MIQQEIVNFLSKPNSRTRILAYMDKIGRTYTASDLVFPDTEEGRILFLRAVETCRAIRPPRDNTIWGKAKFLSLVFQEYFERVDDREAKGTRERYYHRGRITTPPVAWENKGFSVLVQNWMNPDNLTDVSAERNIFEDLIPA